MNTIQGLLSNKKSLALLAGISLATFYEFTRIEVPSFVEKRFSYRFNYLIRKLISKMARIASRFNHEPEAVNLRRLLNRFSKYSQSKNSISNSNENINITYAIANNVRIKIYTPKQSSDELSPAMVYFHGGAYILFTVDDNDQFLIEIADELKIVIISVDYPLAPENKYPIPIEQAFTTTQYLLNNLEEFDLNLDTNRIIIAGYSAGANIATTVSNQLRNFNENIPKLQALINPPTQFFNFLLPSAIKYSNLDIILSRPRAALWHMGLKDVDKYQEDVLVKNYHTLLLDEHLKHKYKSYLDINLIPEIYRKNKSYYDYYDRLEKLVYPQVLDKTCCLNNDEELQNVVKNLFNSNISPCLLDDELLKNQPKTFMIVSELDSRKDEGLIYAGRLSKNGVSVDIAYFENGFHSSFLSSSSVQNAMKNDLVNFIRENL